MTGILRRVSFRWAAAAMFAAVTLALVVAVAPAQAATNEWRSVYYSTASGEMQSVVALSKTDAWAAGVIYSGQTLINKPYLLHWNGSDWGTYTIPGATGYYTMNVAASSADNVWVFGVDANNSFNQRIFRFDGSHWHAISVPQDVALNNPVVFSATDAWTLGNTSCTGASGQPQKCVTDLWNYNGTTWRDYPINEDITDMAGPSASDLWVVGVNAETQLGGTGEVVAYKWYGTHWVYASMPHLRLYGYPAVGTDSSRDVWFGAWTPTNTTPWALHWNGAKWGEITAPRSLAATYEVTPDGNGGVWMGSWVHWTGRAWVNTEELASPIQGGGIYDIIKVPGTSASYWGAAGLTKNSNASGWHPAMAVYGPTP
jgi:hypothetical protein